MSSPEAPANAEEKNLVIVDLGKKKRGNVKKLRKGRGALVDQVRGSVEDLMEDGVLNADAQVVVVVVEQKPKRRKWPRLR